MNDDIMVLLLIKLILGLS